MKTRQGVVVTAAVAMVLATAGLAAGATISSTTIEKEQVEHEVIRHVTIKDSTVQASSIGFAAIHDSQVAHANAFRSTIKESYLDSVTLSKVLVEDSRVNRATIKAPTFEDATLCFVLVPEKNYRVGDDCVLLSNTGGHPVEHARLVEDAPATISPGESYELEVRDADFDTLTVRNDPGGVIGLGFNPDVDPVGLTDLAAFRAVASNESVESFELIVDGEVIETFQFGETVNLPADDYTLRVNAAESGIVDHTRLGLVLDMDGHPLRPAITQFDVVATNLAFLPLDKQPFAPFVADNLARLVASVPTDEFGNVDRDLSIEVTEDVTRVDSEGVELVGDIDEHAYLHDDSRVFSPQPFLYKNPSVFAAHHPQTLETLVSAMLPVNLEYGALGFYGTHLVVQSPFAANVTLTATAENAHGEMLEAQIDIPVAPADETNKTISLFGGEFLIPGAGTLLVDFVDENGDAVQAQAGWTLSIQETPDSHQTEMVLAIDEGATSVEQELAESAKVGTPFGNFLKSEYEVCLHHDGERDCAADGGLVAIEDGETARVSIVVE